MEEELEMERGLPVVLRRRYRWVSPATEKKIEEAWGPRGRRQICRICHEERLSHRSLRLYVNAHFLLNFCPCGYHNVYPYPVIVHKMNCFARENRVVVPSRHQAGSPEGSNTGCSDVWVPDPTAFFPPEIPDGLDGSYLCSDPERNGSN